MAHHITLRGNTHRFDNLTTLLAKATPLRSGDQLAGLPPAEAAQKLFHLMTQSLQRGLSGVELKDETPVLTARASKSLLADIQS